MDQAEILAEQRAKAEAKAAKASGAADDSSMRTDLAGMEKGGEQDVFEDEMSLHDDDPADGEEGNDGDEHVGIKALNRSQEVAEFYAKDGVANWFNYDIYTHANLAENHTDFETNDWYLRGVQPVALFGASIKALENKFADYETVSAYDKKSHTYTDATKEFRPHHAKNEGLKGLAMYPNPVVYHTAGMSEIVNISIAQGCPASCSFCKESLLARGYTQADFAERTGILRISFDGVDRDVYSKTRIKYWDPEAQMMIAGPISIPLLNGYPIDTYSLSRMVKRESFRALYD